MCISWLHEIFQSFSESSVKLYINKYWCICFIIQAKLSLYTFCKYIIWYMEMLNFDSADYAHDYTKNIFYK